MFCLQKAARHRHEQRVLAERTTLFTLHSLSCSPPLSLPAIAAPDTKRFVQTLSSPPSSGQSQSRPTATANRDSRQYLPAAMAFVCAASAPSLRRPRQVATDSSCTLQPSARLRTRPARRARWTCRAENAAAAANDQEQEQEDDADKFRPHGGTGDDVKEEAGDYFPVDLVEGYLDNAKVRPKIDIDADEYMLMWKLRKMLHEDDFKKIFDNRRIGGF